MGTDGASSDVVETNKHHLDLLWLKKDIRRLLTNKECAQEKMKNLVRISINSAEKCT